MPTPYALNFFVIEKQSSEEEMQPIKKKFCVCFVFSTCKEYESFVPLAHKLQKRKAIPHFFHLAYVGCVSWYWVGRLDWKKRN